MVILHKTFIVIFITNKTKGFKYLRGQIEQP